MFRNPLSVHGLVFPEERTTGLGCIPEGRTVSYQCTVTDTSDPPIGSTIWRGSAFMISGCIESSLQITLAHSSYEIGAIAVCGNLTAVSVGVSGTEYTSRLTLTATTELNGTVISCTLAGIVVIGSDTVYVGG